MHAHRSLQDHLEAWAGSDDLRLAVTKTVTALGEACREIATIIAVGPLTGKLGALRANGSGGDFQTELDVRTNELLVKALSRAPVAAIASEEMDAPLPIWPGAPIMVALDPLDGSSNIDTNVSVGTIFSLLHSLPGSSDTQPAAFLRAGREQVAAGYFLYGPQTALALTLGEGTDLFTLDRHSGTFRLTAAAVRIPPLAREFAINASNYRHWDGPIRQWFNECLAGAEGARGEDFNMRWIASMVAEAHRILMRGGVYLYPGDARQGYRNGRLRLLYEANPIGFLIEQAGGAASTGRERVLDRVPCLLHERVPFVFGGKEEVSRVEHYHLRPEALADRSPLFGERGLFRV
ncbi:MAG TPA: class 1 fructose-bisphosphatase [Sphingomicrobium sp.]|nr:class 1 fructose-bisphosphatase [Sphingomicrobium sp.]